MNYLNYSTLHCIVRYSVVLTLSITYTVCCGYCPTALGSHSEIEMYVDANCAMNVWSQTASIFTLYTCRILISYIKYTLTLNEVRLVMLH